MDSNNLLPYSQETANGPYPESDKSSSHLPTLFLQKPFKDYYCYILHEKTDRKCCI